MLGAAAQFVDVPDYSALILRRNYRELALPGGLMSRSHTWWRATKAHWDGTNFRWTFPSGAQIQFGYLEHEGDESRYQSSEFQYIGFDELTQFTEEQYTYMFSRLRRLKDSPVPIRMRGASNPGNKGHEWVQKRFGIRRVNGQWIGQSGNPKRIFIPAKLDDNPYIDRESYRESLGELTVITRGQLESGDWGLRKMGGKFDPDWFPIIQGDEIPDRRHWLRIVRNWDLASSEASELDPDPDWTAGCKYLKVKVLPERIRDYYIQTMNEAPPPPYWIVLHEARKRATPGGVEELLASTAAMDGAGVPISIEQERGASGKLLVANYATNTLAGYKVFPNWAQKSKVDRASITSARAQEGRIMLVDGPWVDAFLDEHAMFTGLPNTTHDDQVDSMSGAHIMLEKLEVMLGNDTITQSAT